MDKDYISTLVNYFGDASKYYTTFVQICSNQHLSMPN